MGCNTLVVHPLPDAQVAGVRRPELSLRQVELVTLVSSFSDDLQEFHCKVVAARSA